MPGNGRKSISLCIVHYALCIMKLHPLTDEVSLTSSYIMHIITYRGEPLFSCAFLYENDGLHTGGQPPRPHQVRR